MAEFVSWQIAKITKAYKSGTVVLSAEHSFPQYYSDEFKSKKTSLENIGLDRFVLKMTKKAPDGSTIIKANLPFEELKRVYVISENLLKQINFGTTRDEFTIYAPPTKYFRQTDEKGHNLCYTLNVKYSKNNRIPIQVTIENFYAPLKVMDGGTTQIMFKEGHDKVITSTWLTVEEWFDFISHLESCWKQYNNASFEARFKNSLKPR